MSILFAAVKAIAGLAAATDVSLTVANLATEGAAFFPEINDAKAYIESAREEIPLRIDALNAKRVILNDEVELISNAHLAEKETYENGAKILEEVTKDLESVLKDKGLSKESIAANPVDFQTFVESVKEHGGLKQIIFGTHVGTLVLDSGILAWTLYSDFKFYQTHTQALNKMPPKAKKIFFGSSNPNFFKTLPRASRSTLLKNGSFTAISLAGIGINIYTASLTRDEFVAMATIERKNLEALDQAQIEEDAREKDQDEMAEALREYYLTIMTEFLKVTEGSAFHFELLAKNKISQASDLANRSFEQIAEVLPDVKVYLDGVIYEILAYKAKKEEKQNSDVARAVDFLTIGISDVSLLQRRLYARVPADQQYLSLEDLTAIIGEYSKVIGLCTSHQPVPTSLPDGKFLKAENFQYIYDFAPECAS